MRRPGPRPFAPWPSAGRPRATGDRWESRRLRRSRVLIDTAHSMTPPLRVVQCGTGNTGSHALRFLLEDPTFDVVGVLVGRRSNVGKTASELAGLGSDGIPSRGAPGPR